MTLETYRKKRDFAKTAEPEGRLTDSAAMLRFVVQLHDASRLHYDFRLEWDGVLLSWAVPKGPSFNPTDKRLAVRVEDHPLDYRAFEGTIPKGEYGGGTVMVWDEGTWRPDGDAAAGLANGSLKFTLDGTRLNGRWTLVRMKPKPGEDDVNWLLIKEKDEQAQNAAGIAAFTTSAVSGRTLAEIAAAETGGRPSDGPDPAGKLPFAAVAPMLARLVAKAPDGDAWLNEIKFDGYRLLGFLEDGVPKLLTRNGLDWTATFPSVAAAMRAWNPGNVVVDGEVIVLAKNGRSDFQLLQNAIKAGDGANVHYVLFDLLAQGSTDLRDEPLHRRKTQLETLVENAPPDILYSFHQTGAGRDVLAKACAEGQEGIVAKRADSAYRSGRNGDWLKIKCDNRQEFVIGGYTTTEKSTTGLSALLLGVQKDEGLTYVGRAGTGFTQAGAADLLRRLKPLIRKSNPFLNTVDERKNETVTFVRPRLVAEIKYAELTADGWLRQASFKGVRGDKPAAEVVEETPRPAAVTKAAATPLPTYGQIALSSPERIVYPEENLTKKDVADYYWAVRTWMLPYVVDRPMTLVRCTDGIAGECFFQKHMNGDMPGMARQPFLENDGEPAEAMVIRDEEGLLGAVQMGAVEFHGWGSRSDRLEQPDMLVFDLDPDPGMAIDTLRRGVRDLKALLDEAGLKSFLKTSGGKGYHVVVPLMPTAGWDSVRAFAKRLAEAMAATWPDRYTANMRKANRKGRIYVDWVRNGRGATSVCNFSLRARAGAPLAWPLRWSDLNKIGPADVTLANHKAYKKTLGGWKGFFRAEQRLKPGL